MSVETAVIDRRGWAALLSLGLGVSVVIMDATIVNVALPVVMEDLDLSGSDAQWINASYALVFAALLITVGRYGDLHGRRKVFGAGLVTFMLASLVAGSAGSATVLVGARLVQGLGAAMIVPSTLSTLNATFTGRARTIAFAVWGAAIGGMAAVGPLLGGWLATEASWRWAFWLNIPVGLLVLVGVVRYVPETFDASASRGHDVAGVLLSSLGMGAVVFALIESGWFGWWRQASGAWSPVPFAMAGGLVLLVAFVLVERGRSRSARHVLVDLDLFRLRSFRVGVLAALIVAFGEFGLLFTLPLLLQGTLGFTALGTGAVVLALALGTFFVSGALPRLSTRLSQRTIVQVGLALEALAVGLLALTLSTTVSTVTLVACLVLYGVGVGMATAQLTSLLLADVPVQEPGQASGLQSTIRQFGSALGVALLGGLLVARLAASTRDNLTALGLPADTVDGVTEAVKDSVGVAIASLQSQPGGAAVADAASAAMVQASRVTTGAAAVALTLGLLATLALPRSGRADAPTGRVAPAPAAAE
ncbi:MAG TPA: MFS transporter [Dermatophilaceae bacterium]|nr:MFS transporter [Dermatophilaceae bacterium]